MRSDEHPSNPQFAFYMTRTAHLTDQRRRFALSPTELLRINPNTGNCPVFRTHADAGITTKLYAEGNVLIDENNATNPWGAYYIRLVHPGDHADKLKFYWEADQSTDCLVYEAKLFWNYDHRFATFDSVSREDSTNGKPRLIKVTEKEDTRLAVLTRYWVDSTFAAQLFSKYPEYGRPWWIVWRDITNATNERTCIVTILPKVLTSVEACVLGFDTSQNGVLLTANLNSIVLDFAARQKLGGMHLNYYIFKQLPVLPPGSYQSSDATFITARVVRLTYTSEALAGFAKDIGANNGAFTWDNQQRSRDRAELDAYYAHLYGLTRDDLRYILDPKEVFGEEFPSETFRVLERTRDQGIRRVPHTAARP